MQRSRLQQQSARLFVFGASDQQHRARIEGHGVLEAAALGKLRGAFARSLAQLLDTVLCRQHEQAADIVDANSIGIGTTAFELLAMQRDQLVCLIECTTKAISNEDRKSV